MPLVRGYSDNTRRINVQTLIDDGYPYGQAVAISYRIQREELRKRGMSTRRLARRHNTLARANPLRKGPVMTALKWLGASAAVGGLAGGVGSAANLTSANLPTGIVGGAAALVGITSIGGLVVGLADRKNRDAGLATAGIGLAALLAVNLVTTTVLAPKAASA